MNGEHPAPVTVLSPDPDTPAGYVFAEPLFPDATAWEQGQLVPVVPADAGDDEPAPQFSQEQRERAAAVVGLLQFLAIGEHNAPRLALRVAIMLNMLADAPESMSAIARRLGIPKATAASYVNELKPQIVAYLKGFLAVECRQAERFQGSPCS